MAYRSDDVRFASVVALLVGGLASIVLAGCASQQCDFHSQCGSKRYCERGRCLQDCRMDFDCDEGQHCNEIGQCVTGQRPDDGGTPMDGGVTPRPDAGPDPRPDAGRDPRPDSGPPPRPDSGPPDSGPPPAPGEYLDRCSTDADCASGRCVDDIGGTRMCTKTCSSHSQCASEHVCADGVCRRDDTGSFCTGAAGCVLGLCAGNPATGAGECTRTCSSGSDCPAGYACADAGGAFICVNIERPCAQCSTGVCTETLGCRSTCRTAADCPRTLPGLEYTCLDVGGGARYCEPSLYVLGPDPIGAACRSGSTPGTTLCRSGACITDDLTSRDVCTQVCTEQGGCGPGFGCFPVDDGSGGVALVCLPTGNGALGSACTQHNQCASRMCHGAGYCTRLCTADGLCPSDMTCRPQGLGISACER